MGQVTCFNFILINNRGIYQNYNITVAIVNIVTTIHNLVKKNMTGPALRDSLYICHFLKRMRLINKIRRLPIKKWL